MGLAFNCTFLLFGSVIQLIACARYLALYYTRISDSSFNLYLASFIIFLKDASFGIKKRKGISKYLCVLLQQHILHK